MNVAVFHPGTQHSWQTALALQQLGRLEWYATSIFYQPDRWPYRLEQVLPGAVGQRLHREFRRFSHPALDPGLVRTSGATEWLERMASRAGFRNLTRWLDRFGNDRFISGIERDLRGPERFALWGFNASSERSFALARKLGRPCILDRTNGDFRIYNAMMADLCAALPEAEIRVMGLPAMARIMRIPEERLRALSETSPVFAPGASNYLRMGAIDALWSDDLAARLLESLDRAEFLRKLAALSGAYYFGMSGERERELKHFSRRQRHVRAGQAYRPPSSGWTRFTITTELIPSMPNELFRM